MTERGPAGRVHGRAYVKRQWRAVIRQRFCARTRGSRKRRVVAKTCRVCVERTPPLAPRRSRSRTRAAPEQLLERLRTYSMPRLDHRALRENNPLAFQLKSKMVPAHALTKSAIPQAFHRSTTPAHPRAPRRTHSSKSAALRRLPIESRARNSLASAVAVAAVVVIRQEAKRC